MVCPTSGVILSIGWPPRNFSIFEWNKMGKFLHFHQVRFDRSHALASSAPYLNGNNYEINKCIKVIQLLSSPPTYNIISVQLQIKYIWWKKVVPRIFLQLTPTLMNMQWWSCLKEGGQFPKSLKSSVLPQKYVVWSKCTMKHFGLAIKTHFQVRKWQLKLANVTATDTSKYQYSD